MSFVYADFIAAFPEFTDTTKYPETSFNFWQSVANLRLDVCRWGQLIDQGGMLFIAHNMATQARNAALAAKGKTVGSITGPNTAKSVDKLSSSQDTSAVTMQGAGDWNSTVYGVQFYQLMMIVGAGGRQF